MLRASAPPPSPSLARLSAWLSASTSASGSSIGRPSRRGREQTASRAGGDDHAPRFVIQRHRARGLHYDFRLEIDGVLVSWAVPKGVTLDPDGPPPRGARRGPPARLRADFEGVIPGGEYGGGDVIVWDRGTWELHGADDRTRRSRHGEIHVELLRREAARARRARPHGAHERAARSSGSLLHKRDDARGRGLGSRGPPPLGAERPDQRRGGGEPGPRLDPRRSGELPAPAPSVRARAGRPTTSSPRSTRSRRRAPGPSRAASSRSPTSTRCCSPPATTATPSPSATSSATTRRIAPMLLPYLADRPLNLHRFPDGVDTQGLLAEAGARVRARLDPALATTTMPTRARARSTSWSTAPPALVWLANHAAVELHPWTSRDPRRAPARRTRSIDLDPGTDDDVGRAAHAGAAAPHRARAPRRARLPEGDRAARHPGVDPDRARADVRRDAGVGRAALAHDRRASCRRARQLDVGEARPRAARARLDYTQNAINKTLVAPYSVRARPRARRCRCRSRGTSSTTPTSRPTAGRSAPSPTASPTRRRPDGTRTGRRPGAAAHQWRTATDASVPPAQLTPGALRRGAAEGHPRAIQDEPRRARRAVGHD